MLQSVLIYLYTRWNMEHYLHLQLCTGQAFHKFIHKAKYWLRYADQPAYESWKTAIFINLKHLTIEWTAQEAVYTSSGRGSVDEKVESSWALLSQTFKVASVTSPNLYINISFNSNEE